jgi:hypothetical protein
MIEWIKKTLNPPGVNKPNRLALFSTIGQTAGKVRADAIRAFNAHFPYLADREKLKEHADALLIPDIPYDSEEELRERVSTASFYLAKAGERGYILEQLTAHFGNRHIVSDDFLNVYVKITDLDEKDRAWVMSFLDGILDPNIAMTVAEWFHFIDTMTMSDSTSISMERVDVDVFQSGFCYDGRFLCDQGKETICNGGLECDGSWQCDQFMPARGTIFDIILASVFPDGVYKCNGAFDCSGYTKIHLPMDIPGPVTPVDIYEDAFTAEMSLEPFEDQAVITAICDGSFLCDGGNQQPFIDLPMKLRIVRPFRCDGTKRPSCSQCDGSIICDGSYTGFDGLYYSGDLVEEEFL